MVERRDAPRFRTVYAASAGTWLFQMLGAVLMLPFGALLAGGLTFGGREVLALMLAEASRDPWSLLRTIPLSLFGGAFGLFLTYALLRHGGGSLLDALGAKRSLSGEVEARRIARGTRGGAQRYLRIAGEEIRCPRAPYEHASEGKRVRVRFGRFERELDRLEIEER